jgi:VanZ family protein
MARIQTISSRLFLVAAIIVITYLATTPDDFPVVQHISDKVNHLAAFYVLAFLADFSFPKEEMGLQKAMAVLAYGLMIEIIQIFLPARSPSLLDLLADGAGIAIYWLSLPILKRLPFLSLRWRVEGLE